MQFPPTRDRHGRFVSRAVVGRYYDQLALSMARTRYEDYKDVVNNAADEQKFLPMTQKFRWQTAQVLRIYLRLRRELD